MDRTCAWLQDPELRRRVDCSSAPTLEGNRAYWRARRGDACRLDLAIVAGDHVGNCGLAQIDRRSGKAELWIYLGERRGAGIGRAAGLALLRRAYEQLGLHRVYVRVLATNPEGERFFRSLGFVPEGRTREDSLIDGQRADSLWLGMLAREWAVR